MKKFVALLIVAFMLGGCAQKVPKDALQLSPTSLADRQMQTRRFETGNYEMMLTAASQVFQDLGFNLDETERQLGILVGSKKRSAVSGGQIAGAILLAILVLPGFPWVTPVRNWPGRGLDRHRRSRWLS